MLDHAQEIATSTKAPIQSLIGVSRADLTIKLKALGVPERQARMRVSQLWGWTYVRGVTDFASMTDIAKELRAELARHFTLSRPEIVTEQISEDGTRKWLLRLEDG
jgi:23S rRNA (adenine2503-C2)-methyltransferase